MLKAEEMKASKVLKRYAKGERDFQGVNLCGQSFKGKNLSGADFSDANLKGANFKNSNLRSTNFAGVKCGLKKQWIIILIFICVSTTSMSAFFSIVAGTEITLNANYSSLEGRVSISINSIVLLISLLLAIRYEIKIGAITVAFLYIFSIFAVILNLSGINFAFAPLALGTFGVGLSYILVLPLSVIFAILLTIYKVIKSLFIVAVSFLIGAILSFFAIGGLALISNFTGIEYLPFGGLEIIFSFFAKIGGFSVVGGGIASLAGVYIGWRAMKGDKRDIWIKPIAIVFSATGGTNFHNADLTDADFAGARLKSTDMREAILTHTRWHHASLDLVRTGETYLKNKPLRKLLIDGEGQNKNFDRQDLRGVNLKGANLTNASFIDADFYQANLKEANLFRAILVRSNFERADLRNTNLTGSCIQDWVITESTKLDGIICDYVYLKWVNSDKRDQMPPRGKFKKGGFVTFVRYILDTVELYHEKDINPRLALTVLQKMSRDYDEPLNIVALGKKGERVFVQVKVSENIVRENLKDDYYHRYDTDLKLWSGNIHQLPPTVDSFIEKRIREIASEKTDDFVLVDATYVEGNYTEINQGEVNMSGDRNIEIKQGNYNENIEGDYIEGNKTDQSRKIEISGGTVNASGAGAFSLGDISGTVANSINQIPASSDSNKPNIKQLLSQLKQGIETEPNLEDIDKYDALEEIDNLAKISQDKQESEQKNKAQKSIRMLQRISKVLPAGAALVTICKEVLPAISDFFGF